MIKGKFRMVVISYGGGKWNQEGIRRDAESFKNTILFFNLRNWLAVLSSTAFWFFVGEFFFFLQYIIFLKSQV